MPFLEEVDLNNAISRRAPMVVTGAWPPDPRLGGRQPLYHEGEEQYVKRIAAEAAEAARKHWRKLHDAHQLTYARPAEKWFECWQSGWTIEQIRKWDSEAALISPNAVWKRIQGEGRKRHVKLRAGRRGPKRKPR